MTTLVAVAAPLAPEVVGTVAAAASSSEGVVSGVTGWAGDALVGSVLSALGASFVDAAQAVSAAAVAAIASTTSIDLSVDWFRRNLAVLTVITLPVLVGLFAVQVALSVLRRDPGGLARAVVGVGNATIGAVLAIAVTQSALVATDQICVVIAAASGTTVEAAAMRFLQLSWLAGGQAGPVLQMVLGLLVVGGSLTVWAVLLFRKTALVVVAVFVPVAFAGSVLDATRVWTRRWVEAVAALVLCKVPMVVVFVVGASAFSQVGPTAPGATTGSTGTAPTVAQGLSDVLVGVLLLVMAALSPWVTWRFLHWAGAEAAGALTGAVMASPIPGTARAVAQQARFTGNWAVTQAAFKAMGRGAAGHPGAAGGVGSRPGVPPSASGGGASASDPAPSGPGPTGSGPAGSGGTRRPPGSGGSGSGGAGGWRPPATRVRGGAP